MARAAGAVRQLAHDLHAASPLGGGGCAGPRVPSAARAAPDPHSRRVSRLGQHQREGPPRWDGCAQKNGPQAIGKSRGGWNTKIHLVAANERMALTFALSPGQAHDAPEGRKLLSGWQGRPEQVPLVMDRAYEGDETRQLVLQLGFEPVVPPQSQPPQPLDLRPPPLSKAQRGRAPVPQAKRLSPHLLTLRKARPHVHRLHPLCPDCRYDLC